MGVDVSALAPTKLTSSAAADHGVPVFNAPFQNTRSVAELVISEIVALHRRLFDRSAAMHAGQWMKSAVAHMKSEVGH